ncbi:hypothetical protein PSDVSF_30610 [Pseudodesulfovibrio sediminis]|uniref:Response regulator receiver modulated metal dependent phosphohydrolase n=2 Tax=Pseudodesulfovibrio sediminis TaxID=2810563 RepID=A0ABN6EXB0_9BACT|nr:hypothetical protein PSDVSF_30610 [Pseudodesulfovibrio sediminis]
MVESDQPFAVVVSDFKMPFMSGVELLAKIKEIAPETVRMVLTGYADLEVAISAVNRGDIFRFLTKPCDKDTLMSALKAGVEQYEMVQSVHELAVIQRLKDGLESTLRAFIRLVEFRDPYTAGHMDRTAEIATLIAEKVGLSSDRIEGLRLAAMVHDIGKIAIPSGILNKPGILNDAEFALIKTHSLVGSEIFELMDTGWPIARIILEHHERLDGTGYPNGLCKEDILEESQILAVADVIDAIMTHRPYRLTLGRKKTIEDLEAQKGISLNAESVEAGIELLQTEQIFKDVT